MAHTIDICTRCGKDFMYHESDYHLRRNLKVNDVILKDYPIQDETWKSRRWNNDRTEYADLSGGFDIICQDCDENEKELNEIRKDLEKNNFVINLHEFTHLMLNQLY